MKPFTIQYKVQLDDVDYMGIVGHGHWMFILERARAAMLEASGVSFAQLIAENIGVVVAQINIQYLYPAKYGDNIELKLTPCDPTAKGGSVHYEVRNQDGRQNIEAKYHLVFVNAQGRPIPMPENIKAGLYT